MNNPINSTDKLKHGFLADIMSFYMLASDPDRNDFLDLVKKQRGKADKKIADYNSVYGYTPAPDLIEFYEAFKAYDKYCDSISEVWMLNNGISYVSKLTKKLDFHSLFNNWELMITLLTGLEHFGSDPCGDSCFFDMLPNPFGTTQVIVFNHESGKLGDFTAFSIADFIADLWGEHYDEDNVEESKNHGEQVKKIIDAFNNEAKKVREKRTDYHNPRILFKRTHWIMGHPSGEPTYAFAKAMAEAPTFEQWQKEIKLLKKEPVLANYWLLAHLFLNNINALKKTIKISKKSNSLITKELANLIEEFVKDPHNTKFGKLTENDFHNLKEEIRKNCSAEMLEPKQRAALASERGEDKIKKLSVAAFKKRVAAGDDPMTIIQEYPDDVKTHDRALKEIANHDKDFEKLVNEYFRARSRSAYNTWRYGNKHFEPRLSVPISAAFRSGLKFDEDHDKAFAGITKTLGKYDDDYAFAAYKEAIEKLNPDDERIESVINNISKSKHVQKDNFLIMAADQFFKVIEKARDNEHKQQQEREQDGLTLNNMFDIDNNFLKAIYHVLKFNNDVSLKLAEKILKYKDERKLFRRHVGDAFRIAGDNNLSEHSEYMRWYIEGVAGIKSDESAGLDEITHYLFTEAVIAYTKLEPGLAEPLLKEIFIGDTGSKWFDLDVKSGVLPGLIILDPENRELHNWVKRFLGNRSNNHSIRGALRAVTEIKLRSAEQWVLYHLYSSFNDLKAAHFIIKDFAREALNALGVNAPDFDDDDEYASSLAKEGQNKLIDGFNHPEKYYPKYICDEITDNNFQSKEAATAIKNYLEDLLSYSNDDNEYLDLWKGLKALAIQGVDGLEACTALFKTKSINSGYITNIIYVMRTMEGEAAIRKWLCTSSSVEIAKELVSPQARFIAWQDLLAAHLLCIAPDQAATAIKTSFLSRYNRFSSKGWDDQEPTLIRLPLVCRAAGEKETIEQLLSEYKNQNRSCYQLEENLKRGLEYSLSDKIIDIENNKVVKLQNKIKGEDFDEPEYFLEIMVKDNVIEFTCIVENLYFNSFVKDQRLESRDQFSCDSFEAAKALAEVIVKSTLILNYK